MIKNLKKGLAVFLTMAMVITLSGGCTFGKTTKKTYEASSANVSSETKEEKTTEMSDEDATKLAMDYMKNMTVEQKIGQMFVVNLELLDQKNGPYFEIKKFNKRIKKNLERIPVGGVILYSRNINTRKQTTKLISKLQENSSIPMFISVDEEGGDVSRIASNSKMDTTSFPTNEEIGKNEDEDYVYNMGCTIGEEIKELGFNVDFAPVSDVNTSELNAEIGTRSFGSDPDKVSEMVEAFVTGMQEQNVSATLKHFPGQGSSSGDTHKENVNIDSSISRLRKIDFKPFQAGIDAGADFIMVSHISVSQVTETSTPASMSQLIMQTILRDELGFEGIVITDAFNMISITKNYDAAKATVAAVEAGADIVLMPENLDVAYNAVLNAVNDSTIDEKLIDEAVLRILKVKFKRGVIQSGQ